jgi:hypothetical protein
MAIEFFVCMAFILFSNHAIVVAFFATAFAFGWWQMGVAMAYNEMELRK